MRSFSTLMVFFWCFAVGISGCLGGDDAGPQEAPGESPAGTTPSEPNRTGPRIFVNITDYSPSAEAGGSIRVTWTVETDGTEMINLTHTDVHYGNESVPDPEAASGGSYASSAGETASGSAPGTFDASFNVSEPGTLYLRAHAEIGDAVGWSEEVSIEVQPSGETVVVRITNGAVAYLSGFSPRDQKIKVGDSVVWKNEDDVAHAPSANDGTWKTGDIAANNQSEPIVFDQAGTFAYRCTVHPQTMTGTIVVE